MARREVTKAQLINWKLLKEIDSGDGASNAFVLLSASKMADQIGVARRNIEANIKKLKERGILIRHGSPKNGYWEIECGDRI